MHCPLALGNSHKMSTWSIWVSVRVVGGLEASHKLPDYGSGSIVIYGHGRHAENGLLSD